MSARKNLHTAQELWSYFRSVIEWVESVFPKKRSQIKGLPWGLFYNEHGKRKDLDPEKLEKRIRELIADEDVSRPAGAYEYLLTGNERVLNLRSFDKRDRQAAYEKQWHKCAICGKEFDFSEMHGDHKTPWSKSGKTVLDNCQMLCTECNIKKSNK